MNDETAAHCAEALLAGEVLPPVAVFRDGEGMWLADGFHRVAAAKQAGLADIEAVVHDGGRREALLHAVGANARHGLRRTNADKRRAVEMLLADNEWGARSDNWIAEKCGVSHPFVGSVRASTCNGCKCPTRETANGRVMETANIWRKAANDDVPVPVIAAPTQLSAPDVAGVPCEPDGAPVAANDAADETEPVAGTSASVASADSEFQAETGSAANDDAEVAVAPGLLARLDAAGATVVQLLRQLATADPVSAWAWVKRLGVAARRVVAVVDR